MAPHDKQTRTIRLELTIEVPATVGKREWQSEDSAIMSRVLEVATHRPQDKRITIADALETVGLTVTDVSNVTIGNETPEFRDVTRLADAWYLAEVRGCADGVMESLLAIAPDEREQRLHDLLHEAVDGRHCIIATAEARMVLVATDNHYAIDDVHGEDHPSTVEQRAFYAMEADVNERIQALREVWHPDHMPDADESDDD